MSSKRRQKDDELPIYDPEGVDPQTNVSYEEVKVPMQDHITATRRAIHRSWNSVMEAWLKVSGDTRNSLAAVAGKTRQQTNSTLSSLGVGDSRQVLRGSAYAGAAVAGIYLARRRSMFLKVFYPLLGVGLVGVAIHRDEVYSEIKRIESRYRGSLSSRQSRSEKMTATNLEKSTRSKLGTNDDKNSGKIN